ncbi:MAG: hypothetical protein JXP73_22060 [Deltaproteobacteria bacterium]|nr:hypothetical protein [Deltaproteobacteria bacterium]
MRTQALMTVEFGELVLAVYDEAARYSHNPREVACLVTQTVQEIVWRTPKPKISWPPRIDN